MNPGTTDKNRRVSIDVLRGLTVALMILVNNAGDGRASYAQLRHSVWNGCTLTDTVFPMFLFIMGVSMAISFQSRLAKQVSREAIAKQIIRRSALIFFIGLVLNSLPVPHLATLRYFGVLQRIGLCYLAGGLVLLYLGVRGVIAASVASLLGYWLLLSKLPVPGFGWPGIEIPMLDPQGNLASYLDRLWIPQAHRYHFTFYDPEGILSTIPAVATTWLGVLTGIWMMRRDILPDRKLIAMASVSALFILTAMLWNSSFPMNKRLWTSSYALFTGGISLGLLTVMERVVDHKRLPSIVLEPLLAFGRNALTAYVFSEVLAILIDTIHLGTLGTVQGYSYSLLPATLGSASFRSLVWSMLFVVICFVPVLYLRRRGLVVKL